MDALARSRRTLAAAALAALALIIAPATAFAKGPPPPDNITPPTISGQALQGQTLTGDPGKWKRNPTAFDYQWLRCDAAGDNCVAIAGAIASTYTLIVDDAGATIRLDVTATNKRGDGAATSAATGIITGLPPQSTAAPTVSGEAREGRTLTADPGSWANTPTSFAYRWQRCSDATTCSDIAGATDPTYVLTAGDVDQLVRVVVTGTSAWGQTSAASQPTATVAAAPSDPSATYTAAILASGPNNFYRFENDDPADHTLFNEIRPELGARNNETTIGPGRVGNAIKLVNNGAGLAGLWGAAMGPDMTIEFWIRPSSGGNVLSMRHPAFGDGPTLTLADDGRLGFNNWSGHSFAGSIPECDPGACNLFDGAWHHVAYTQSTTANENRFYTDGVLTSTGLGYLFPSPHSSGGWFGSIALGWDFYSGGGINAEVDEIATYDHALPPSEVAAHYAAA